MKKALLALLCAGFLLLGGCGPRTSLGEAPSESEPLKNGESSLPESEPKETNLLVADAAMYRGTIASMAEGASGLLLTLEQAKGTNFGAASIEALLPPETVLTFPIGELEEGGYLEIYYGGPLEAQPVTVIAANLYPSAEMVNFNGVVGELRPDSEDAGTIVLFDIENGQEVVYHYAAGQTQLYLDLAQIQSGDQLNIFHRGIYTMSLPPQGSALEIRRISEPLPAAPAQPDGLELPALVDGK